jgi:hypothetical protein
MRCTSLSAEVKNRSPCASMMRPALPLRSRIARSAAERTRLDRICSPSSSCRKTDAAPAGQSLPKSYGRHYGAHAIAVGIEAAGHPALGWNAHFVRPMPSVAVHAAAVHDGEHIKDEFGRHGGNRVHAPIGQGRRHNREIPAIHEQRALLEINIEDVLGVALEHVAAAHQISDGPIAPPSASPN